MALQLRKRVLYLLPFLFIVLFVSCSGDEGDSSARFKISTPSLPQVQEMAAKTTVSLEIAGKVCLLTIDSDDWTLSGSCPDIPTGSHSFTIKYERPDLGVTIASASGNATLESKVSTTLTLPSFKKDQDDDGDGYTNLVEAMFETDPKNIASKPGIPPFSALASYSTGSGPSAIALGDLNNDAILDVVTTNEGNDTVTVRLGNADGTLQVPSSFVTGVVEADPLRPRELVLKDLDGNGNLDIVVINSGEGGGFSGNVAVLLGNGDGTFQAATPYSVGSQPVALALGDLTGDGIQDAVTGNFVSKTLSVLIGGGIAGVGDGTFTLASTQPNLSGDVTALALGDVNGDTKLDLVASIQTSQSIAVLIGNGNGTFQSPKLTTIGLIISVALQDLNKDTRLDIVAALASDTVAVLLGNGDGNFQTPTLYKAGKTPGSLAFADLDKDGNLDLVTENEGEGLVAILMGMGDGSFRSPVFFEAGTSPSWVALGDLNGDGGFDFVLTDRSSGNVMVLLTK